MRAATLAALLVIVSCATTSEYFARHAQSPEEYVVSKFKDHDVVFLGEFHRIKHDVLLVHRLIPRLYAAGITNLGIELGENADQAKVDALLNAPAYDENAARRIWQDFTMTWPYVEYEDIYRAAWELNHTLPPGAKRFRVVNLGYRCNWKALVDETTPRDVAFHRGDMEQFMANVIFDEFVARGEKALVFAGYAHAMTRARKPNYRMATIVADRIGDRAFFIFLHAPILSAESPERMALVAGGAIDRLIASTTQKSAGFDVKGTPFAALPLKTWYGRDDPDYTLGKFCDGYIVQGPLSDYEGVTVDERYVTAETLQEAIDYLPNPAIRKRATSPEVMLKWAARDAEINRRMRELR